MQLSSRIHRAWEVDSDDFCLLDHEGESGAYVDLIENPERFTGYSGPAANRIWESIYEENCFSSGPISNKMLPSTSWQQCVERKTFYRAISGRRPLETLRVQICGTKFTLASHQLCMLTLSIAARPSLIHICALGRSILQCKDQELGILVLPLCHVEAQSQRAAQSFLLVRFERLTPSLSITCWHIGEQL